MTTLIYQYDNNYFYTKKSRIVDKKNDEIPTNYTDAYMPDGLLRAKLTNGAWTEGATDTEKRQARTKTSQYIEGTQKNSIEHIREELNGKIEILTKRVSELENLVEKLQL